MSRKTDRKETGQEEKPVGEDVMQKQDRMESTVNRKPVRKPEAMIYIGPSIPGTAFSGTVYSNGLPEALLEAVKEVPAISTLIVPAGKLAEAGKAVKKAGTAEAACYERAARYAARKRGRT